MVGKLWLETSGYGLVVGNWLLELVVVNWWL